MYGYNDENMMKTRKFILLLLVFPLFFACSSQNDEPDVVPDKPEPTPPTPAVKTDTTWTLRYAFQADEATRAAGHDLQAMTLSNNARAGVFGVKTDNSFAFENLKYKPTGKNDELSPDEGINPPSKLDADTKVVVICPYNTDFKELPADMTFTVKTDQTSDADYLASDLLWGQATAVSNATTITVPLRRKLSRWMFTISLSGGLTASDFQGATFALYNVYTSMALMLQREKLARLLIRTLSSSIR